MVISFVEKFSRFSNSSWKVSNLYRWKYWIGYEQFSHVRTFLNFVVWKQPGSALVFSVMATTIIYQSVF